MSGFAYNPRMAAYRSTLVHGGVANADPHALVQMLLDAALDRMTQARGCIERGELVGKAKLLHSCVIIIAELRSLRVHVAAAVARQRAQRRRLHQ